MFVKIIKDKSLIVRMLFVSLNYLFLYLLMAPFWLCIDIASMEVAAHPLLQNFANFSYYNNTILYSTVCIDCCSLSCCNVYNNYEQKHFLKVGKTTTCFVNSGVKDNLVVTMEYPILYKWIPNVFLLLLLFWPLCMEEMDLKLED